MIGDNGTEYPTIGILALQGGFREHGEVLAKIEPKVIIKYIRNTADLTSNIHGLILPGGESTTMSLLMEKDGLGDSLRNLIQVNKIPTFGTCAGMILLSRKISGADCEKVKSVGSLDVEVYRNYYGSQIASFSGSIDMQDSSLGINGHGMFIRAPHIAKINSDKVRVLAVLTEGNSAQPVAVRQDNILGLAFHPELTGDLRWHRYFLSEMLNLNFNSPAATPS